MASVKFPPNSGDLNRIDTVWARLRRDLAVREMADLKVGRCSSVLLERLSVQVPGRLRY